MIIGLRELSPDSGLLVETFLRYMNEEGQSVSRAVFQQNLESKLSHPGFVADCGPLLRTGASFDPASDARLVEDKLLSLLPGAKLKKAGRAQ